VADRRFQSPVIEAAIMRVKAQIADPVLARMFERCFPNTLDTTVFPGTLDGKPDTFVITGDIDAMWLRDSSAQMHPYVGFAKDDAALARLIAGVIRRQTQCILIDPYANAFSRNVSDPPLSWSLHDQTEMKPGVAERKWELDSLCYTIRLAHAYWKTTGDTSPFDDQWHEAVLRIPRAFREQQRKHGRGPYHFTRNTSTPTDSLPGRGYGNPAKPVGLIFSMFRPSDDATVFPFLVPSNFFAVISLRQAADMLEQIHHDTASAADARSLAGEVEEALRQYAVANPLGFGNIYPYEVDAYGDAYCIDDGNIPSLLSLPYLGVVTTDDPLYVNTRKYVLSSSNPYYCKGKAAEGPGGPHVGVDMIWPLGIITRGLTSTNDQEIRGCLETLRRTHAGTGFMHEAFHKDDPKNFTRSWFAWANTIFGELVLKTFQERPHLLD
jgi:meiotically up-regulated gene 157 (Mug157) protein